MIDFDTFNNCLRMWEIWANLWLPKALKNCPKSNKSPNLVTLSLMHTTLVVSREINSKQQQKYF